MTLESAQRLQSSAPPEWAASPSAAIVAGAVAALSVLIFYACLFACVHRDVPATPTSSPVRPAEVREALDRNDDVYYFGVGSNLSRTRLEQRSVSGKKIRPKSMEPCRVEGCRLAFNMRASPPLEPAFGSLEPLPGFYERKGKKDGRPWIPRRSESEAVLAYGEDECHGALIRLSAEDYRSVFSSEGGDLGALCPYEEIVVVCIPYDASKPPVRAVAYRTRDHARSRRYLCPSRRYMNILREGAAELGLDDGYQKWLRDHPVSDPLTLNKRLGVYSIAFSYALLHGFGLRSYGTYQGALLERVYVPPTEPRWRQVVGEVAAVVVMLPPALGGLVVNYVDDFGLVPGGLIPPVIKRWMQLYDYGNGRVVDSVRPTTSS